MQHFSSFFELYRIGALLHRYTLLKKHLQFYYFLQNLQKVQPRWTSAKSSESWYWVKSMPRAGRARGLRGGGRGSSAEGGSPAFRAERSAIFFERKSRKWGRMQPACADKTKGHTRKFNVTKCMTIESRKHILQNDMIIPKMSSNST